MDLIKALQFATCVTVVIILLAFLVAFFYEFLMTLREIKKMGDDDDD